MVEVKGVRGGRSGSMSSRRWRAIYERPRAESSDSISNFAGPNLDTGFKRRRMGHPPANKAEESAWSATFPLPYKADSPNSTSPPLSRPPWMGMASSDDGMEESVGSNSMQSTAAVDDYYSYTPSTPNASHPFFSFPDYTPSTPPPSTPPPNSPFYTPATPLLSPPCIDYYSYTPSTPNASDPFSFPDYTPSTPPPSPPPPNSPFYTPATPPLSPICHTLSPFQLLGSH